MYFKKIQIPNIVIRFAPVFNIFDQCLSQFWAQKNVNSNFRKPLANFKWFYFYLCAIYIKNKMFGSCPVVEKG